MPVLEMPSWGMVALALTQAIAMLALLINEARHRGGVLKLEHVLVCGS